ncbi:hypothetical protein BASA81_007348 [Batrachochytrium salamandrivorans]|nr:hypothetical protein BASA81_007348 [Batrachochytrium salamandrivorans]
MAVGPEHELKATAAKGYGGLNDVFHDANALLNHKPEMFIVLVTDNTRLTAPQRVTGRLTVEMNQYVLRYECSEVHKMITNEFRDATRLRCSNSSNSTVSSLHRCARCKSEPKRSKFLLGQTNQQIDRLMAMVGLPSASADQVQGWMQKIEQLESKSAAMEDEGLVFLAAICNVCGRRRKKLRLFQLPRSSAELAEHQLKTANDNVALAVANLERLTSIDSTKLTPAKAKDHQVKVAKAQTKKESADLALTAAQEKYSAARSRGEEV